METWIDYADYCERRAAYEASRGNDGSAMVLRLNAQQARNAAKALALTKQSGVEHCACHCEPFDKHHTAARG